MKKILMIVYYFPPTAGGGVQRSSKFAKYLLRFGWKPVILTVKNSYDYYTDESLKKDVVEDISIYRSFAVEPMKMVRRNTSDRDLRKKMWHSISVSLRTIWTRNNHS